jgi:hypothetical protein
MSYDANGNMIKDLDRDIVTIKYNLLNLPKPIQFKNGCQIKHTYAADGQKLSSRYVPVNAGVYQPLVSYCKSKVRRSLQVSVVQLYRQPQFGVVSRLRRVRNRPPAGKCK